MTRAAAQLAEALTLWPLDSEQRNFIQKATADIDEGHAYALLDLLRQAESEINSCANFLGIDAQEQQSAGSLMRRGPVDQFALNVMRTFMEHYAAQAQIAFDSFFQTTNKAFALLQVATQAAGEEANEIADKSMVYAELNLEIIHEFAQELMRAKDPLEAMRVQSEYLARQMAALSKGMRMQSETLSSRMQELSTGARELGQSAEEVGKALARRA